MAAASRVMFPLLQRNQGLIDKKHKENIFTSINSYRKCKAFTDVVILTENAEFHAHRLILASSSPVLETMLSSDMKEKAEGRINLTGSNIRPTILEIMLMYMYSGKLHITIDNVEDLLYASTFLMMQSLREFCEDFLIEKLSISNCLGLREIASKYECKRLFSKADHLLKKEFLAVSNAEEFYSITPNQLSEILSEDGIEILEEDDVLRSLIKWIAKFPNERKQFCKDLIKEVRLQFLSNELLKFVESYYKNINSPNDDNFTKLIQNAWYAKNEKNHTGEEIQVGKHIKQRDCLNRRQIVFLCGGYDGGRCLQSCLALCPIENKLFGLKCMGVARQDHAIAELEGFLYVVGGFNSHRGPLDCAECYNPIRNEWTSVHPMNAKRKALATATLNGKLFATGGLDGSYKSLNSTEYYDPDDGLWHLSSEMNETRYSHCLVSDGKESLYAIGGWELSTVERYDPIEVKWELVSEMSCCRAGATAELVNRRIFVVGGRGFDGCLVTAEAYDIQLNQWALLPEAPVPRWRAASCLKENQMYIFGGRDSSWQYLDCIERFDIDKEEWHKEGKLFSNVMALTCCTIEIPKVYLKKQ